MDLRHYQEHTVKYLEKRCVNQHGLLLFHNMGTGKTITATAWLINRKKVYTSPSSSVALTTKRRRSTGGNARPSMLRMSSKAEKESDYTFQRVPTENRPFKYLIICPETIRNSWDKTAVKMGFDLDSTRVWNYERFFGKCQSGELLQEVEGANVIFDEAHHLCGLMRADEMKYYTRIMKSLRKTDKLLLLTGTPEHKYRSDFMILVNVVAGSNRFPVNDRQLREKYRNMDEFKKRKHSFLFNFVKPLAWPVFVYVLHQVSSLIQRYFRESLKRQFQYNKKYQLSLGNLMKKHLPVKTEEQKYGSLKDDDDASDSKHSTGGFVNGLWDKTKTMASNKLNEAKNEAKSMVAILPRSKQDVKNIGLNMGHKHADEILDNAKHTGHYVASEVDEFIYNTPGQKLSDGIYSYAMNTFRCLEITHDPQQALAMAKTDYDRMASDIGRYVSFYQQDTSSMDYGNTQIQKPTECLLTEFQCRQVLYFVYDTMRTRMVQYYTGLDYDEAKLKVGEFRTMRGVIKYGRCISNMWDIVGFIIHQRINFLFSTENGSVTMQWPTHRWSESTAQFRFRKGAICKSRGGEFN